MKKSLLLAIAIALVVSATTVIAAKPETNNDKAKKTFKLPAHAVEVSEDVFYLGKSMDNGKVVEGYAFVHKKDKHAKATCGNNVCERGESARKCPADCGSVPDPDPTPDTSSCYEFMARSAKWKTSEPFVVNPTSQDLTASSVLSIISQGVDTWETAANYNLAGNMSSTLATLTVDSDSPDGLNEVFFGSIASEGAIAVTSVWGIFGGPPRNRELVEWDQVYDEVDFDWSDSGEANKMDLLNIAVHEIGHSFGLSDLYNSECSTATMYGYASTGETNKQSLDAGDIEGINKLYQ